MSDPPFYLPRFRNQIGDPTTIWDAFICTWSSGAMLLDRHTMGAKSVWGGEIAKASRLPASEIVDGSNLVDLAKGWAKYGQTLDIRNGNWADVMSALAGGRGVVLQGDYDRFSSSVSCQPGFTGGHAIYINHIVSKVSLYVGDPLCWSFKEVPLDQVREYGEKLARQERGTIDHLFYAVSKITPPETGAIMPGVTYNPEGTPVIGVFTFDTKPHALIRASDGLHVPVTSGLRVRNVYSMGLLTTPDGRFRDEPAYETEISSKGESYFALKKDGSFVPTPATGTNVTYNRALDDSVAAIGKLRK